MVPPGSDKHCLRGNGEKKKEKHIFFSSGGEKNVHFLCAHTHIWAKGQRNQFPLRDEESRLAAGKDDEATQTPSTESPGPLYL